MKEIYKDIKGYEGYYQISNLGNVKSVERIIKREGKGDYPVNEKIVKSNSNGNGYLIINLRKDKKRKSFLVHRLVAQTFINNPEVLPQVNHIDEDTMNNTLDNLEWCTAKYNINHSKAKPVFQYSLTGELIKEWESATTIESDLGYFKSNVSSACYGNIKTYKGFKWAFVNIYG
jgi:hypothetical protein